ncbi:hypothetical protein [Mycoplasma bradburyae]|uniref:Uncharacterized protein n=1 Tax=Mycoplasma bradburyae TaxID=2963128 RepID=A0ABT5GA44_9MOLU|nr:hypothetical protein [Mycoplasma bradburyae]MDC4162993.1 hypothetical protein [Mycoplasma bradburyae]MDC4181604.1 hypothetical protein [Mycoplasma bradburyae]MDC4183775.1 hypothetical protein [Mycoplasma bradburyae]UTS69973.1 hypothetical protein NMG68_03025 [Mycoplasma bradburyae]
MNQKPNPAIDKNNNLQQVIRPSVNIASKQQPRPNANIYQAQAQIVNAQTKKDGLDSPNKIQQRPNPNLNQNNQPNNIALGLNPRPNLNAQQRPNPQLNLSQNPNNLNGNLNRPNPNLNNQQLNNRTINSNQPGTLNILNKLQQNPNKPNENIKSDAQGLNKRPASSLRDFVAQDETNSVDDEGEIEAPITSLKSNEPQQAILKDFNQNQKVEQSKPVEKPQPINKAQSIQPTQQPQPVQQIQESPNPAPEETAEELKTTTPQAPTPTPAPAPSAKQPSTHPSGMTLEDFMRKKLETNLVVVDEETLRKQQEEKDSKAVAVVNENQAAPEEEYQQPETSSFDLQYDVWTLDRLKKFSLASIFMGIFSSLLGIGVLALSILYILNSLETLNVSKALNLKSETLNAILVAISIVYVVISSIYRALALVCVLSSNQISSQKNFYSYDFDSLKAPLSFSVFFEITSLISYPMLLSKISKTVNLLK